MLVFVPFMDRKKFAESVGITPDTLERQIRNGKIKTFRLGKRSLVDLRPLLIDGDKK